MITKVCVISGSFDIAVTGRDEQGGGGGREGGRTSGGHTSYYSTLHTYVIVILRAACTRYTPRCRSQSPKTCVVIIQVADWIGGAARGGATPG